MRKFIFFIQSGYKQWHWWRQSQTETPYIVISKKYDTKYIYTGVNKGGLIGVRPPPFGTKKNEKSAKLL